MNTATLNQPGTMPRVRSAQATCHISGDEAGSIRVDCRIDGGVTEEDILRHFRLLLPGEAAALEPRQVVRQRDQFIIGFTSADIANSGQLPARCRAVWQVADAAPELLLQLSVQSATEARRVNGVNASQVPGGKGVGYPRTVGVTTMLALFLGGAMVATVVLLLM